LRRDLLDYLIPVGRFPSGDSQVALEEAALQEPAAMLWLASEAGERRFVSDRWASFTGRTVEEALGWGWLRAVHPDDARSLRQRYERRGPLRGEGEHHYRLRANDGSFRWVVSHDVPTAPAAGSRSRFLVGAALELSDWQRVGPFLSATELPGPALAVPGALVELAARLAGPVELPELSRVLSAACEDALGVPGQILLISDDGESLTAVAAEPDRPRRLVPAAGIHPAAQAFRTGFPAYRTGRSGIDAALPLAAGVASPLGVLLVESIQPATAEAEAGRSLLEAVAAMAAGAIARGRERLLLAKERARSERRRQQIGFLSLATTELAASLDLETTVEAVTRLSVPSLSDVCEVHLGPSGDLRRSAVSGGAVALPLRARGRVLGSIVFRNRGDRPISPMDRVIAEELAALAAVAIDNALLYQRESDIAHRLQQSLLPERLPEVPGLEIDARYRPATAGLDVGGDFYDSVRLSETRLLAVVGDVKGKGVAAAATTGLARHTIRSAALFDPRPTAVLSHLNAVLLMDDEVPSGEEEISRIWREPRFCSAAVVLFERVSAGRFTAEVCCAGHPLPLLRQPGGAVQGVGRPGSLIGIERQLAVTSERLILETGSVMVLYSDGVSESQRGGEQFGADGIAAVLASERPEPERITRRVEIEARHFSSGGSAADIAARDDMVVMAIVVSA
jgi:PAS domain S-box-containing protein